MQSETQAVAVKSELALPGEQISPPEGSAAFIDSKKWGAHSRRRRDILLSDPSARSAGKVLLIVLATLPMIVFLAMRLPPIFQGPVIAIYGVSVLSATIFNFILAFGFYSDPSIESSVKKRHRNTFPSLETNPRVTLLVAVMNEIDVIDRCVSSLVGQSYDKMEVVVIDDCSTDGTTERLRELQEIYDFVLIASPINVGKKKALVQGVEQSSGRVLAFTDSDCVLAPDAVSRCVDALIMDPRLGAVSGHARALNADSTLLTRIQDAWYEGSFRVVKAAESSVGSVTCVSGPLAVFRKEAVWNYFPAWQYDTFLGEEFRFATDRQLTGYVLGQRWVGSRLKAKYSEDDFVAGQDYPERRWQVGYVHSAKVWTVVPESMQAFLKQQIRWKKSFIRNLLFTGLFMFRRGLVPSILFYGHCVWVLAAPAMAALHLVWAPLMGLWLLTALYLCGVILKGTMWAAAFAYENPGSNRWVYRIFMGLVSSLILSWLLPYALLTIRRGVWSRTL
ncbi:glycosyltransferase family 2 protein [Corynebacterium sputi]|uniref:glycosyltransferase family 2 protein n=1 Tax=Corynebacterium sputi TaxID=489915 RepID=UPI000409E6B6|nr:glycosyltransferase [Corynebacterium sputi]